MDSSILKTVKEYAISNKPISLFLNRYNLNSFACGYYETNTNEEIILKCITPNGLYDGYLIAKINDIIRINYDGQYEKKIHKLSELNEKKHLNLLNEFHEEDNLFCIGLKASKKNDLVVTQYGGPDGELGAALRYLNQRYTMPTNKAKGLLTDIGTEELAPVRYRYAFFNAFCFDLLTALNYCFKRLFLLHNLTI